MVVWNDKNHACVLCLTIFLCYISKTIVNNFVHLGDKILMHKIYEGPNKAKPDKEESLVLQSQKWQLQGKKTYPLTGNIQCHFNTLLLQDLLLKPMRFNKQSHMPI